MADITLFELHLHDGLSFSKSSSPEPEATEPPVKTASGSEGEVAPGIESEGSGLPLKAVGALVVLGLLAAVAVAIKFKGGDVDVADEVDELSDAL